MKKIIIIAAVICAAVVANAAAIGWSAAGMTNFKNDAYNVFVIGQNGVTDIAQITSLLDAGSDVSSYAFGSGVVNSSGAALQAAASSGKTLDAGTYTSFMVLFDSASPTSGTSKYTVISGAANQTQVIASTTANATFGAANVSSIVNDASKWKSYGAAPEPTTGLLILLGMAGLALKRKVA